MSYLSKDSGVQGVQLKVQELSLKLGDPCLSVSGVTAVVDVKETIQEVRSALHIDDSAGSALVVAAASRVVSGTQVTLTLAAAPTAADCIIVKYVIAE